MRARFLRPGLAGCLLVVAFVVRQPARDVFILAALMLLLTDPAVIRRIPRWRMPLRTAPALIVATVCVVLPKLIFTTGTLSGWDFPVHTWHTHVLADHLGGRLRGWTWMQAAGWPEGDQYASFVYLPAALLHWFTLGLISIPLATHLEATTSLLLWPVAIAVLLGRRLPMHAAVAGGVLVALDPGAFHQVGLIPYAVAGMWPARMSLALCVVLVVLFQQCLQSKDIRLWIALGITSVVASQSHVAAVTYVGFAVFLAVLALDWRTVARDRLFNALLVVLAGMATTAWLVLPFYAQRDLVTDISEGGAGLAPSFKQLLSLETFGRMSPVEHVLGAVGLAWLWRRDRTAARFAVAALLVAVLLLNKDVLAALLPQDSTLVTRFQWSRYLSMARACLVFAAGALGARIVTRSVQLVARAALPSAVAACLAMGLLGSAVLKLAPEYDKSSSLKRVKAVVGVEEQRRWSAVLGAARRVKAEAGPDVLLAVDLPMDAAVPTGHASGLVEMAVEIPVLSVQRQGSFEYADAGPRTGAWNADELTGAGVTHLIATSPNSPVSAQMTLLQDFGDGVRLYVLPVRAADHRVHSDQAVRIGPLLGETVTLEGPGEGFSASLRMRWHPRWTPDSPPVRRS